MADKCSSAEEGSPVRFLVPLATLLALGALAGVQIDASSAAEGSLLALSAAVVLSCVAALAASTTSELLVGSGLLVAAAWTVPAGPTRGAAFSLCLLGLLAWAASRRLQLLKQNHKRGFPFSTAFPMALGLQTIYRPEVFLDASVLSAGRWLIPVILSALAAHLLARRYGLATVLLAGACTVAVGAGWRLPGSLAWLAIASADLLLADRQSRPKTATKKHQRTRSQGWGTTTPVFIVLALAAIDLVPGGTVGNWSAGNWYVGNGSIGNGSIGNTVIILLALALTFLVPPARKGTPSQTSVTRFGAAIGLIVVASITLEIAALITATSEIAHIEAARSWSAAGLGLAWLPLLVPLLAWPLLSRKLLLRWIPYALLALVALRWTPGLSALSAPLVLVSLSLGPGRIGRAGQGQWALFCTAGAALAAGYPWLRSNPLEAFLELLGLPSLGWLSPTWLLSLMLVAAVGALIGLTGSRFFHAEGARDISTQPSSAVHFATTLLTVGIITAFVLATPPRGSEVLQPEARTLTSKRPRMIVDVEPQVASRFIVDSNLAYAVELEEGRPVATLSLHHDDGSISEWVLRAGRDTAEWAAGREDIAARKDFSAPAPWQSTVAPEGGYFAQRFRSRWEVESALPVVKAIVLRRPRLPKEVQLTVYRLELVP